MLLIPTGSRNTDSQGNEELNLQQFTSISQNAKIANLSEAYIYSDENSIRNQIRNNKYMPYSILATHLEFLGKFGIGLQLYFYFIKKISILFFILVLLSIYPMYSNYEGKGFESTYQNQRYTYFTLANQAGVGTYETNLTLADSTIANTQTHLNMLWPIQILSNLIFLLFIPYYLIKSRKLAINALGNHKTVADFAIEIKGFSPYITEEQVANQFSIYSEIQEIYLSRKYGGRLGLYKKVYEKIYDVGVEKKVHTSPVTPKINLPGMSSMLDQSHDELPVDTVFVVFKTIQGKVECLKYYNTEKKKNNRKWCKKKNINEQRKTINSRLSIKDALNPSDIIWENYEYNRVALLKVRVPILVISFMVIIVSFAMIYGIKVYFNSLPTDLTCKKLQVSGNLSIEEAKAKYSHGDALNCYCKQQSLDRMMGDSELQDLCMGYIKAFTTSASIKFSVTVCIVLVNSALKFIVTKLSKYGRFSSITGKRNFVFFLMFTLMFFNTALTTIVANQQLNTGLSIIEGKYQEINRQWYDDVGNTVTVTMLVSIFSPNVLTLLIIWPLDYIKKRLFYRCFTSQLKLNKFIIGPGFDISNNLAEVMVVVFTNYIYSPGIPLLNLFGLLAIFLTYWCQKILLLRYHKRPPLYSDKINKKVIEFLPLAVFWNSVFAIYAYGSSDIFPRGFSKSADSIYVEAHVNTIGERLSSPVAICNILTIFMALTMYLLMVNAEKLIKMHERKKVGLDDQEVEFEKLKSEGKIDGLCVYNIYENPKYKNWIKALDAVSKIKKGYAQKNRSLRFSSIDLSVN